jgi:hypothetical protein
VKAALGVCQFPSTAPWADQGRESFLSRGRSYCENLLIIVFFIFAIVCKHFSSNAEMYFVHRQERILFQAVLGAVNIYSKVFAQHCS